MKKKTELVEIFNEEAQQAHPSALELLKLTGGRAKRIRGKEGMRPDSMLAVYKDRVTYTFILDDQVASIHYDRMRGEIYFRGHNIRHWELSESQQNALIHMKEVLACDEGSSEFLDDYSATLDKLLADK